MASPRASGPAISARARITRARRLPLVGEVLVEEGSRCAAEDVVARAVLPGDLHPLRVSAALGVSRGSVERYAVVREGDEVRSGDVVAESRWLLGLARSSVESPVDGVVESVSPVTGQVMIRAASSVIEVAAYMDGRAVRVHPGKGVDVEGEASLVQGIFGVGAEASGRLVRLPVGDGLEIGPEAVTRECSGCVVFAPGRASTGALRAFRERGVRGAVVGGVRGDDLIDAAGREINPAATGGEDIGFTLVVTEGFGDLAMSAGALEVLEGLEGRRVSVSGATQER